MTRFCFAGDETRRSVACLPVIRLLTPTRSSDAGLIKRSIDDISSKKQMFICFQAACDAFGACLDSVPRMPGEHAVSTGTTSRSSRAN
jgi:hypothetical protein